MVVIQVEQQDPGDTTVQTCSPFQELDPIPVWQVQVGGHQRHLLVATSQLRQLDKTVRGRTCGQYSIVRPEPVVQC